MLLDPRWLALLAPLLVGRLLDAPPKALPLRLEELGTLRLPTRSPLPLPVLRFVPRLLELGDAPVRFAPALPVRLAPVAVVPCRADACRDATESPRAEPPYLLAVARSP
jgi:hypothetical protein